MNARLVAFDSRINWAAIAGALCVWDVYAKYSGSPSASRWLRSHPPLTALFVLAIANHLFPRSESHVSYP